ncbi:carboxypeptidase Y inhibitor [Tothia fuscella]|uniref:Carboxypeptidase Y inhibitor n=1 Tax=Tothia fuscella TaxID=1048955 RepID=A0A9P4P1H8_9PEZI|nr:carboxypeptidase Y inhibitor [Tothia fuscella]
MHSFLTYVFLLLPLQPFLFCHAFPTDQKILKGASKGGSAADVRKELKKAEIIPTVIDDFMPSLFMQVSWSANKTAELGNTIKPKKLQDMPNVNLTINPPSTTWFSNVQWVITLTDPDAPSRDNPEWSEMCHWIATGISNTDSISTIPLGSENSAKFEEVMEYKPPGPPPKTGKHRYVFLAFVPANGTAEKLHLSKPKDRQHWGTGKERHGVRDWAVENGLIPVGANFIYSQNKKQ